MKIELINNHNTNMQSTWEDVLSLVYPYGTQTSLKVEEWENLTSREEADLVLYISIDVTDSLIKVMDYYFNKNIPILCVVDHYTENEYETLLTKKLKGLIHMRTTSVKSIKEITDLILEGGYYLEAPQKSIL